MELGLSLGLSASGVVIAAIAFFHRDKPDVQRDMTRIMLLAVMQVMQVMLGAVSAILLSR